MGLRFWSSFSEHPYKSFISRLWTISSVHSYQIKVFHITTWLWMIPSVASFLPDTRVLYRLWTISSSASFLHHKRVSYHDYGRPHLLFYSYLIKEFQITTMDDLICCFIFTWYKSFISRLLRPSSVITCLAPRLIRCCFKSSRLGLEQMQNDNSWLLQNGL